MPMFSPPKIIILSVLFVTMASNTWSVDETFTYPENYDFGERVSNERLTALTTSIPPDGEGLPTGTGTFIAGKQVYLNQCEGCHGVDLTGTELGRPLIGGRGSLTTDAPIKTIESYWPYATSIFSYVRDTMPTTAPGSLSNSEVYSVMAYILASANIISSDMVLDASNVATIQMPNLGGFIADSRPDVFAAQDSK